MAHQRVLLAVTSMCRFTYEMYITYVVDETTHAVTVVEQFSIENIRDNIVLYQGSFSP